jgi:membrane-associated phospholipid phosphatase
MSDNAAFRTWLFAFGATTVAILVCTAYVDRPIALFFDAHLRHTAAWGWISLALAPLDLVVIAALLFLLGCGAWVVSGRLLHPWTRTPLLCSWAGMWATAADIIFKHIFGRAWPDPVYVQNRVYEFRLLHGAPYWDSFPSGTAAISAAIASVLWILAPRWRAISALIVVLLCVAVVVTNYHWIGDVIAGAFLGTSIGWMTVQLHRPIGMSQSNEAFGESPSLR